MSKRCSMAACAVLLTLIGLSCVSGVLAGDAQSKKKAILLVAFGTTVPEAQIAFSQTESRVKREFPDAEVRWAFTSGKIRAKLAQEGKKTAPPSEALTKLLKDGYTQITVASLHTLPGEEFHRLCKDVEAFKEKGGKGLKKVAVSLPLLSSRKNMEAAAKGLLKHLPKDRKPEDTVILMGHGSEHHPGDAVYAALNFWLLRLDPNVYVGTVEGNPSFEDVLSELDKKRPGKAYLMPFMAVAGDHARNDLCGEDDGSWKSILVKKGWLVECVLKGSAEMPEILDVWMENIKAAFMDK
ncbi:MAG: sirohydrochlorin cobaltochelatase [Pseudomonadota bacterium]